MYDDGFGNIYHPKCAGVSCRDIPRDIDYINRKLVHHNHQGRRIRKQNGRLVLLKDIGIDGKCIKKQRIGSPTNKKVRYKCDTTNIDVIHEECLPSFPAWPNQIKRLVKILGGVNVDNQLKEIKEMWTEGTREAARVYLRNEDIRTTYIGRVPWRDNIIHNTQKISDGLRLNTKIISMFFEQFRTKCLVDCSFMLSENGRSVAELEKQLNDFVLQTKRILNFEWPMAVAHLMLDEGASWIPLLVNSTSHTVFNGVAATMSRLLYDLVMENINRVRHFFDYDDRARLIIILEEGEEEFDYWQKINVLLELCKIPRVDHKIYPRMFTEAWIDVTSWFDSESIIFRPLPQPFKSMMLSITDIEMMIKKYREELDNVKYWEEITILILKTRQQILKQRTRTVVDFIIYDSGKIKQKALNKINEHEHMIKSLILNHLSQQNSGIRLLFSHYSAKLFRNDILVQLRNIEEVQNELSNINNKINTVHFAYKIFMEYFTMPDYDIRQYYEISRLGHKLEQLVNFVWDRIHHERQWITKQVSEETSKNYYECEMIEKEWLDCLKKYRSAVRVNEVQKIQMKMGHLAEKSRILKERDEKLTGQRGLLGLPSSPIDCVRIANVCQLFSKLSLLHYRTLLHHESCMRMRISDVDHGVLVAETDKLHAEKDEMVIETEKINEHVTTSKEALTKIQNVLIEFEKLLPVLGAISCQAMKDRHWQQILQDTETSVKVEGNPLVSELLEMNFIEKADKFEQVGAQAEKERVLEKSIDNMRDQWKTATFITHQAGELLTTELSVQMQAHLARSQTILSSPYAFSILDQIRHWLDTLINLNTFVQLYKQCDIRWRKIEGVFSTEDIAYQMPHEFRTFKKISLRWLHINNQITEERPILEQMELVKNLNKELTELEILFGKMESGFHAYLRKKRAVFPRLFGLSDELVLSLICDSREPANCKAYIPLLFPALTTFEQNTKMEIISVSTKEEIITLSKPVNVNLSKRHVEKWMHELDVQLKNTLRTRIRQLIEKMNYKLSPIENILSEPTQVAAIYLHISITFQIENAMKQNTLTILASELKISLRECQQSMIQKHSKRRFLLPIYHILKNASHIVNRFITDQIIYIDDNKWISHLRYYWHMENVFIRVGSVSIRYDYEIHESNYMIDYKLLQEAFRTFIYMNHFGFNCHIPHINIHFCKQIANSLGRPFAICDTNNEMDCKMLIDGSMLFGAIVFIKEPNINEMGMNTERDVYCAHNLFNLKYHFETEITVNTSFMIILSHSSFQSARKIEFDSMSYYKTIDEILSLNSISHRDKLIQKFRIFNELENYGNYSHLWENYMEAILLKITDNQEAIENNQVIDEAIFNNVSFTLSTQHRKLLSKLLQLKTDTIAKAVSSNPIRSSEKKLKNIVEKLDNDPPFIKKKTEELCQLLAHHNVVVVCGASLTGKSRIISKGAKWKNADLHIEFGQWEDIQIYGDMLKEMKRPNKWIVIDGVLDYQSNIWFNRLCIQNTLYPWRQLPIIDTAEKVIIETENVKEEMKHLPILYLDENYSMTNEYTLSNIEYQMIVEIFEQFKELKIHMNSLIYKLSTLKKVANTQSERLFEYLVTYTLSQLLSIEQFEEYFSRKEINMDDYRKTVPYSEGWYTYNEMTMTTINIYQFHSIYSLNFILYSDLIPLVVGPNCQEFHSFQTNVQTELDQLGWHTITLSLDKHVTITELREYVTNCSIMFGGRDVTEVDDQPEGSNFFFIKGIEKASDEVIEWLRYSFEKKTIMKMLLISSANFDSFPNRFRRYLFEFDWMKTCGEKEEVLNYNPYSNYQIVIDNMVKDIKIKEIRDSITNHLIDGMSNVPELTFYEKIPTLKTTTDNRLVRGKEIVEMVELRAIYQNAIAEKEKRENRIRTDSMSISSFDAKYLNLIERVTNTNYGNMMIVDNNYAKIFDYLKITTELNKMLLFTNQSIKCVKQWRQLINDVLRECLLDGKPTVIGIRVEKSSIESEILEDIHSFCCHRIVPPRYLTRLMLSEFSEKHTLEGKGIWETIENKLSIMKFVLVIDPIDFTWFMEKNNTLLSMLILNWWPDATNQEINQEMYDNIDRSELFTKQQIEHIIEVIEQMVELKLIGTNEDRMRILSTIIKLAKKKKEQIHKTMQKYEKGMEKMKRAEEQVAGMQGELLRLQPQLMRTSIETSMLMSTIEKETIDVENAREVVAANENKANEAATKAQSLKAESEAELASAIPALEAAVDALETMTQSDVSSLKTMRFPPYAVRLCMEAVCILLGVKPAKVTNEIGEVVNDYWVSGQKLLSDIHFLAKIKNFARDTTSKRTMKLIRDKYLSKDEFDPEKVKQCSLAAEGLCRWVLAIDMYNQISRIVEPKRERLRKAEVLVRQHLKQLDVKRKALLKVTEKLQGLSDQFSQMCQKKQELETQISSCEVKMERAERLVQALSGEKDKWQTKITDIIHEDSLCVPYSVGSTLALHIFGRMRTDERKIELRKTMRVLFPKLEVTIPCDLKSLIRLIDDPILFINDDERALPILSSEFTKVIVSNDWSEKERIELMEQKTVFMLEYSKNNCEVARDMINGIYSKHVDDTILFKVSDTDYQVNSSFRLFLRTCQSDVNLANMITINNEYSDEEIRHETCEKMGTQNWAETLNHYNEMVESKENDIVLMEKTENEMLDLLGRSKDLDDERAIDLLAEARNLNAAIIARGKEIFEIEQSLHQIETKMQPCIEFSLKIIRVFYSLHRFDPFYRLSLLSLVDVLNTKLFENLNNVKFSEVNNQISSLYWKFIRNLLAWEDKLIVYHLLFHNMNFKVDTVKMELVERINCDCFVNFSSFIVSSTPKTLNIMKYDSDVLATILQLGQVARVVNWKVYSILEHVILKLEKLADEPMWLLLNLNNTNKETIEKLNIINEKLVNLQLIHPSFRIVVAYSNEIEYNDEIIRMSTNRFYFSSAASLAQQIKRIFSNITTRSYFDRSEDNQRMQIIRLMTFHYGLKMRNRVDKEFDIMVDDSDLIAAIKLYQGLRIMSDQPNEQLHISKVISNIIEPLYFSKTTNVIKKNVMRGMVHWIIEGNLSVPADTLLKKIIKNENNNFDDFAHFMQTHDESILCGLNARISKDIQIRNNKKLLFKMRSLFESDFDLQNKKNIDVNYIEKRDFIKDIEEGITQLDGRQIDNLIQIISVMKIRFALKYKIMVAEVSIMAELDKYTTDKSEADIFINISNCVLISAQLIQGEIKEAQTRQNQYVSITLRATKKTGSINPRSLFLICPKTLECVAHVPINTQLPITHWNLRGAYITVGKQIISSKNS